MSFENPPRKKRTISSLVIIETKDELEELYQMHDNPNSWESIKENQFGLCPPRIEGLEEAQVEEKPTFSNVKQYEGNKEVRKLKLNIKELTMIQRHIKTECMIE